MEGVWEVFGRCLGGLLLAAQAVGLGELAGRAKSAKYPETWIHYQGCLKPPKTVFFGVLFALLWVPKGVPGPFGGSSQLQFLIWDGRHPDMGTTPLFQVTYPSWVGCHRA